MTGALLGNILNIVIAVLLVGTIVMAARLSLHLRDFRNSRRDMDKILAALSSHIEQASRAIDGLRENARGSGRDLQEVINEAQAVVQELQIMTDSGNRVAARLESGALRTSTAAAPQVAPAIEKKAVSEAPRSAAGTPAFTIRDTEFGKADDKFFDEDGDDEDFAPSNLQSRAEKELFAAMQGSSRKAGKH